MTDSNTIELNPKNILDLQNKIVTKKDLYCLIVYMITSPGLIFFMICITLYLIRIIEFSKTTYTVILLISVSICIKNDGKNCLATVRKYSKYQDFKQNCDFNTLNELKKLEVFILSKQEKHFALYSSFLCVTVWYIIIMYCFA